MRKRLFIISIFFVMSSFLSMIWGQVSTYRSIATLQRQSYNYAPGQSAVSRLKSSGNLRVVYSDRANNKAFTNPYAQRTTQEQAFGAAYYIVGEKNGYCELVLADPKSIGKPKGLFSFLYSGNRHFKDSKNLSYVGWVPKSKLLLHNHAFVSAENHRPLRYNIGISSISRLYDLRRHFKSDSLIVYTDPYFKQISSQRLAMGGFVYAYKFDETGQAVLISDKANLDTPERKVFGWIPADMLALAGQSHTFLIDNFFAHNSPKEALVVQRSEVPDSLSFGRESLQSDLLFPYNYREATNPVNDSLPHRQWAINLPLSVWDQSKNKLINVQGGDVAISDIRRMANEQQKLNIHLIFFQGEQAAVKRLISAFQNIALKTIPSKNYSYSATIISNRGNRYLPPTENFATWLDYLLESDNASNNQEQKGVRQALQELVHQIHVNNFEDNLIFILGSNQELDIAPSMLKSLAERRASLVFLQLENNTGDGFQDFILQGKDLLDLFIKEASSYYDRYIVDPKLQKSSFFFDYGTDANLYLLGVPHSSMVAGGLAFPTVGEPLSSVAIETVIDTLFMQIEERNSLLLQSLVQAEKKLGVLRSTPSQEIATLHSLSSKKERSLVDIDRNSVSDVYYEALWLPDSLLHQAKEGYLFSSDELTVVIQAYRDLLPLFTDSLSKRELKTLRKLYKQERKNINIANNCQLLTKKDHIAQLFYLKTGVWPNDRSLYELCPSDLRYKRSVSMNWENHYRGFAKKIERVEQDFINERLIFRVIGGEVYYFIPKLSLP